MSDIYYWADGETGPQFTASLQREVTDNAWQDEDLTGLTVTVTLYRPNGKIYKSGAVTLLGGNRVKYVGVLADTQQGTLTGRFFVAYADGSTRAFPKPGRFQVRVS